MEYTVLRSARKSVSLEVKSDLRILVRAPNRMSNRQIELFVAKHEDWLKKAVGEMTRRREIARQWDSPEQKADLRKKAEAYLPARTEEWAKRMNLCPTGIRITEAKTRFGSCSGKNRICYSFRLMAYPPEAIDYVIVHELAHIREKNHGAAFYALVARYLPDWKERKNLLK